MRLLARLWALNAKEPATSLTVEEELEQFANDISAFFDLPWDGVKRVQAATADTKENLKTLQDYSKRQDEEHTTYCRGLPIPPLYYWSYRVEHTATAMQLLGYGEDVIKTHKAQIILAHAQHFHPDTRKKAAVQLQQTAEQPSNSLQPTPPG
ncbi:MAG: hypothetical protein HYS17_08195 [Micavibrio aeruginosavorus]|uniref:Uncharacterized protein n=1 Tax=Micavibrio aeruginosavorus TaxID=349221 RepID=A0A7T5UFT1_9BACT|nr:MAG: hypothetical protein HYS17_08195 [Micavibrio aeruginosavorus]